MASRILIVKLSSMGDVVHTLPAAQALRARFPEATLGWVVERPHAELLRGQPFLDAVYVWDRKRMASLAPLVRQLRRTAWDVAIDFQGLFRSALVARLSGARRRIGYVPVKELAHLFYTDRVVRETLDEHAVERSLKLAATLGATWSDTPLDRPYLDGRPPAVGSAARNWFPLRPSERDRAQVDAWLAMHNFDAARQQLVVLNPHCRKDANRWPAAQFAELAHRLRQRDEVRIALSGAASTRPLCDEIAAALPAGAIWRADGQFGLLGATELFSRAAAMVTGDTGPMHLAVAAGTPVVALFGPANSLRTGPYASDAIVLDRHLDCAPCFAGQHCPLKFDPPRCMQEISVDVVLQAVMRQLSGTAPATEQGAHQPGVSGIVLPPTIGLPLLGQEELR